MRRGELVRLLVSKTGIGIKEINILLRTLSEIEAQSRRKLDLCMAEVFDVLDMEVQQLLKNNKESL